MSNDEERLVVLLEARIRDLEKNMAKASGVTAKTYREMSLGSKRATANMEQDMIRSTTRINQALAHTSTKIGAFGKAMIGGFVGGIVAGGLAGVVNQIREVANSVAEVGDQARMAGLSTKVFQEWKYVAEQARIPVDAITDGLKELQLRADEFAVTGKGSAAEAFARIGLTPQEVKERLKDPSELMLLIIDRTRQMKDTAAGIRIFDELFGGTGGERMVSLLEQGEGAIRDQITAANDLGLVMDDELIAKAAEIDRKFNTIANTVGVTLKSAIVSAADSLMEFIEGFRSFEEQRSATLQKSQADLGMKRVDLENERLRIQGGESGNLLYRNPKGPLALGRIDEIDKELAKLNQQDAQITDVLHNRISSMDRSGDRKWTPSVYTPPPADTGGKGGGRSRASSISAAERERQAVKDLIAELEQEIALVNQSDAAKRAASASRQAGAAATEDERQKIIGLNEALYQSEEANRRAKEASQFFAETSYDSISDLIPKIETGNAALDRFVNTLIEAVAQAALLGSGPLGGMGGGGGGILGAIFSGMKLFSFDGGGHTGSAPRSGGIDGKGGFPAILHPRETIIDHTKGGSGGSAQSVHVTSDVRVTVDKEGNLQAFVERTSQRQIQHAAPGLVNAANSQVVPTMARHQAQKAGGDWR